MLSSCPRYRVYTCSRLKHTFRFLPVKERHESWLEDTRCASESERSEASPRIFLAGSWIVDIRAGRQSLHMSPTLRASYSLSTHWSGAYETLTVTVIFYPFLLGFCIRGSGSKLQLQLEYVSPFGDGGCYMWYRRSARLLRVGGGWTYSTVIQLWAKNA